MGCLFYFLIIFVLIIFVKLRDLLNFSWKYTSKQAISKSSIAFLVSIPDTVLIFLKLKFCTTLHFPFGFFLVSVLLVTTLLISSYLILCFILFGKNFFVLFHLSLLLWFIKILTNSHKLEVLKDQILKWGDFKRHNFKMWRF